MPRSFLCYFQTTCTHHGLHGTEFETASTSRFVSLNTTLCQVCQTRQNLQNHAIAAVHLKEGLHDHFLGKLLRAYDKPYLDGSVLALKGWEQHRVILKLPPCIPR